MKKNDVKLAITLLIIVAILYVGINYVFVEKGSLVQVTVDGEEYGTYPIDTDQEIKINETNVLVIAKGEVSMKEANCPDGICVNHRPIQNKREMIVCLPNKVVVEIMDTNTSSEDTEELDAVTQ